MRVLPGALAAAAVLAVSACAVGVSTVGQQHPPFRTAHSNYALNGRDAFVIICRRPDQYASVTPMASPETPSPETPSPETYVLAAFCRYDSALTEVSGRAAGVTGVTNARLASLIRQTVGDLFPPTGRSAAKGQRQEPRRRRYTVSVPQPAGGSPSRLPLFKGASHA